MGVRVIHDGPDLDGSRLEELLAHDVPHTRAICFILSPQEGDK